jgi:RNA polymerase primary sigma factor
MKPITITTRITSRESEAFKRYLREVSDIKPFETPEEEFECAMKAYEGDDKAREELIRRNLRFVISCAKQYHQNGVDLEDLVNEGNIGIATAAERFDPTMGNKFISYAVWYIKKDILAYLSTFSRTIKLPINKVGAVSKYRKKIAELEQKLQRTVTDDDMLEHYPEYNKDDIELLNELLNGDTTSLDAPVGEDGAGALYELFADSSFGRTDDLVMQADLEVNINRLFSVLSYGEKEILTMLYGLDGKAPRTLADVGDYYEISRESVRQRRDKAFKKIKGRFRQNAKYILND